MNSIPLVVDLDGTLLRGDMLLESAVGSLKQALPGFLRSLLGILSGKAELKKRLADNFDFDPTVLPYNDKVMAYLTQQKSEGRFLVLATATQLSIANKIAEHLGFFDQVIATSDSINLSAENKRDRLIQLFGDRGFDYIGNSSDDLVVWQSARDAYVVDAPAGVTQKAQAHGNVKDVLSTSPNALKAWIKAFRFHQWVKNLLLFVPLMAGHKLLMLNQLADVVLALVIFGLCASSVYILNDVLDVQDDRHHHKKKNRPFASGRLSIMAGVVVFPVLLLVAMLGAYFLLPINFLWVLCIYYVITVFYSFWLKKLMVFDVITLASLYTIRIVAGAMASGLALTFWVLAFSMFIFLSLALVKRYAELHQARVLGNKAKARGRGYYPEDLEMISSLGAASGYLSVMVLALYIQDSATIAMYSYPQMIWFACPLLLFWVSRTWLLAHRGQMNEDPVVFAIKDRMSLCIGGLFGLVFWIAT